jgi:hypothetical protein
MIVEDTDSVRFLNASTVELPVYADHDEGLFGLYDAELEVIKVIITMVNGKK